MAGTQTLITGHLQRRRARNILLSKRPRPDENMNRAAVAYGRSRSVIMFFVAIATLLLGLFDVPHNGVRATTVFVCLLFLAYSTLLVTSTITFRDRQMNLSPEIAKAIERDFSPWTHALQVKKIVLETSSADRVRAAIVICAQGDDARLESICALAAADWRDALVAADLAKDDWEDRATELLKVGSTPHER